MDRSCVEVCPADARINAAWLEGRPAVEARVADYLSGTPDP